MISAKSADLLLPQDIKEKKANSIARSIVIIRLKSTGYFHAQACSIKHIRVSEI